MNLKKGDTFVSLKPQELLLLRQDVQFNYLQVEHQFFLKLQTRSGRRLLSIEENTQNRTTITALIKLLQLKLKIKLN